MGSIEGLMKAFVQFQISPIEYFAMSIQIIGTGVPKEPGLADRQQESQHPISKLSYTKNFGLDVYPDKDGPENKGDRHIYTSATLM